MPHLLQYVSNGNDYGRIKMRGKIIRESQNTIVWSAAKLRLKDFLKELQEARNRLDPPTFAEAVLKSKRKVDEEVFRVKNSIDETHYLYRNLFRNQLNIN